MLAELGVLLKEVVGPLAKAAAEDWCKDRLKSGANEVLALSAPDALKKAVKQSLKNFIRLFGDELENCGLPSVLIKHELAEPLGRLLATESVVRELCRAFETDVKEIDWQVLPSVWCTLSAPANFPEEFEWDELARNYVRRVKGLVRKDEELARQLELDQQRAIKESNEALVGVPVQFNLREYQESLKERFGSLSLDSLDTTGAAYDNLRLWKIFVAQDVRECAEFAPQMYELPKERLFELQAAGEIDPLLSLDALEQRRRRYAEKPIESVRGVVGLEGANSVLRSVILGDPGSGKSTLLRALALSWADKPFAELKDEPIPLLIELRLYAQDKEKGVCNDFLEYLHQGNTTCRLNQLELDALLTRGKAVALFDGVDEVFDPKLREAVVTDIHRFSNSYEKVQMVVTSRWLGYKAKDLRKAEFAHYMLQDLNDEQIKDFLEKWHGLTFAKGQQAERERKQGRLQKAIEKSKAIWELAGNPLLLTMMAILNRNQELPRDRARLYEEASKVLLYQWDVEGKLYQQADLKHWQIDVRDKQAMLRKVAHHMQANEDGLSGNVISRDDLEEILTDYLKKRDVDRALPIARVMIEQLRERNFILCYLGADNYAFVHRTFLEYFCASEFVHQFERQQKIDIEDIKDVYDEFSCDESWSEVLRLIATMVDCSFTKSIIRFLVDQHIDDMDGHWNPASVVELYQGGLNKILLAADCLFELNKTPSDDELGKLSDIILRLLKEAAEDEVFQSSRSAVIGVVDRIIRGWKDNPKTLPWLKSFAQESDYFASEMAVRKVSEGWKNDLDTLSWLKHIAKKYGDVAGSAAIHEIARSWKNDPGVLPWLKCFVEDSENDYVYDIAAQEIARGWRDDRNTLAWLKHQVKDNKNANVRRTVAQEIATGWKGSVETLETLKALAQEDSDERVRSLAIQEIAREWRCELNLFEFWYDIALKDLFPIGHIFMFEGAIPFEDNSRQTALEVLASQYSKQPKTIELLRDKAQNGTNKKLRTWAAQQLSHLTPEAS